MPNFRVAPAMTLLRTMRLMAGVLVGGLLLVSCHTPREREYLIFVAVTGHDGNPGKIGRPLRTVEQAKIKALQLNKKGRSVRVLFRRGIYQLTAPLAFGADDSALPGTRITFQAFGQEQVIFSGGRIIENWQKVSGNLWRAQLTDTTGAGWYFRQLFDDDKRLQRARHPNTGYLFTEGPVERFKPYVKPWNFDYWYEVQHQRPEVLCGFAFRDGDLAPWPDQAEAEVHTLHSWESSWQTIQRVDTLSREALFNTPSVWPVGFFGAGSDKLRYSVENVRAALDQPGEWLLNGREKAVYYLAADANAPISECLVAPVLPTLLVLKGDAAENPVANLSFIGIKFRHAAYQMGNYIHSVHQRDIRGPFTSLAYAWPEHVRRSVPAWPREFGPGFSEPQGAIHTGQAIELFNAKNCRFVDCEVSQSGAYGFNVHGASQGIEIVNCTISDVGAGGIMLGEAIDTPLSAGLDRGDIARNNLIRNNTIHNTGKVFPGSVGIWIGQAYENRIVHNEIADLPYSGISLGWTWGEAPNHCRDNVIANNYIHHTTRLLADGGAIYTLGQMGNTFLTENLIHDVFRSDEAEGAPNNGFFFDQGSGGMEVSRNICYNTAGRAVRFNPGTKDTNLVVLRENYFDVKPGEAAFPREIAAKAGPRR